MKKIITEKKIKCEECGGMGRIKHHGKINPGQSCPVCYGNKFAVEKTYQIIQTEEEKASYDYNNAKVCTSCLSDKQDCECR